MKCGLIGIMIINLLMLSLVSSAWSYSFDGREWRQVTETTSISWNQLDDIYNVLTGDLDQGTTSVGSVEFEGWTWASSADVAAMFSSFPGLNIGDNETVNQVNSPWAPEVFNAFDPTIATPLERQVIGLTRETRNVLIFQVYPLQPIYTDVAITPRIIDYPPPSREGSGST